MAKRHKPWIEIRLDIHSRRTLEYVAQMQERKEAMLRAIPYIVAKETLKGLLLRIPSKDEYRAYRESLKICEVKGLKGSKEAAYVIRADIKSRRVGKLERDKVVLYVRAKSARPSRTPKAIQILIDMGPWTIDTMPFWPPAGKALVIKRKVSKREVADIRKKQEKPSQKLKVRSALMKVGRKLGNKKASTMGDLKAGGKAIPDVAMQALSLEWGGDGQRAVPAWRESLIFAKSIGLKTAPRRYRRLYEAMYDPRSKRWRNWPEVEDEVSQTELGDNVAFQKKLGY